MPIHQQIVLIGEPDQATFELYQRALCGAFGVIAASNAVMVEQLLRTEPLAALVLELAIFSTSSWEQVALVGHICAERNIVLVICSTQDERRRCAGLGAAAYLLKPTLPATLLSTLQRVLDVEGI
jgi:DNA-binding response OmpR family regulator